VVALILDTGGLIAFDRGDRQVAALLEVARRRRDPVITSSGCVAQAWRGGGPRQTCSLGSWPVSLKSGSTAGRPG
jgi:hypothetical protein